MGDSVWAHGQTAIFFGGVPQDSCALMPPSCRASRGISLWPAVLLVLTGACVNQANEEKLRLEEKQRQERNATEAAGKPWQARWFAQVRSIPSRTADFPLPDLWSTRAACCNGIAGLQTRGVPLAPPM